MNHSLALPHSNYRWLNRETEYEIIRRCQAGQMSAKNYLARLLHPYLDRWLRSHDHWITTSSPLEDLHQVAWLFSDRALTKFDFDKGYRFWTYFKTWATKAILKFLDCVFNRKGKIDAKAWLSLDFVDEEGDCVFHLSDSSDLFEDISADLMQARYRSAILEALEVYEDQIQQIVLLRLHEGWKWKRIAEHLDLKESTCQTMLRKVKAEIKANLEYVLQRPLTLGEIEAMEVNEQWQAQLKAATAPVEPQVSLAELQEQLTPFFDELLEEKFEQFQEQILVLLSLVPKRDRRTTPTGDRNPSISAPPIWRWTAPLIALVTGLCLWLWPHAFPGNTGRGHPPRLRGPDARGHPNLALQNTSRRLAQSYSHLCWQLFWRLKMLTDLLRLCRWLLKPKPSTRRLLKWGSIVLLAIVALFAVQSPSLAGFITSAETFARTTFPEHDAALGLVFAAIRWVGFIALGVIVIGAFQARRRSGSVGPSKLNKR